jgi:hypothetical protein
MASPPNLLNNVRLVRGQTKVLKITVKTCDGAPASLNGCTLYMTTRASATATALIQKSGSDGFQITDASAGEATLTLSSTDTDIPKGSYYYDIWVVFSGTPPIRHPVVKNAEFIVESSMTDFS